MGKILQLLNLGKSFTSLRKYCILEKEILFLLPSGRAVRQFREEPTRLMNEWLNDSPKKDVKFNEIMIIPSLLLQKRSQKLQSREHLNALEQRMDLWDPERILELPNEGETTRTDLITPTTTSTVAKV